MKKLIPLFFLFILIAACAAPQPQVTVTSEVTVTLTLPPIPTPSPETAQQKRERVASELIRAGASANDPESWQKTAEGAAQYEIFGNAVTPAIATDKKLAELDAFVTDLRRADMEQWIAQDTDATRAVLAAFARLGADDERKPTGGGCAGYDA